MASTVESSAVPPAQPTHTSGAASPDHTPNVKSTKSPVNKPVFSTSAVLIVAFVLWAWLLPTQAESVIFGSMDWVADNLGWYYVLTITIVVVFVLVVALSKDGR